MYLKFAPLSFLIHVLFGAGFSLNIIALSSAQAAGDILPTYATPDLIPVKSIEELLDSSGQVAGPSAQSPGVDSLRNRTQKSVPEPGSVSSNAPNETGLAIEKGLVLSSEEGKPVEKAMVILSGPNQRFSCQSDRDGIYHLEGVKPGSYKIKVSKKGFSVFEQRDISLLAGENPVREIRLERSVLKGQVIEAKGGLNAGSASSMQAARRSSSGVMEGVGAEQISKSTDADAGAVAKRITGTSLVGGKYIYVRGLGERYTNMTLNGLPVPSPEKDKRVVPQDLFPAATIESFAIHKTFSPELYSDFAGGSVELITRGIPEKAFLKLSIGTGGTDFSGDAKFLNWGNDQLTYDGGNTYWGIDDGTRSLPKGFPTSIPGISDKDVDQYHVKGLPGYTTKERLDYALKLRNIYAIDTARILPYQNFSLSFGDVRNRNEDTRFGYLVTAGFKNKYIEKDIRKISLISVPTGYDSTYIHSIIGKVTFHVIPTDTMPGFTGDTLDGLPVPNMRQLQKLDTGVSSRIATGTYEAILSGMADFGYSSPDNKIFWKNFFVNIGTDEASRNHSKAFPGGRQDNPVEEGYLLNFSQRSLLASQAGGGHYLGLGPLDSVAWASGYSHSQGTAPDNRRYKYYGETDTTVNTYANNDIWGTRIFETLNEDNFSARVDQSLVMPPEIFRRDTLFTGPGFISHLRLPTAQTGQFATLRSRDFSASRYQYGAVQQAQKNQTLEQIRDPKRLTLDILDPTHPQDFSTAPKSYDEYSASERVAGGYAATNFGFSMLRFPLTFDIGIRYENYHLHLKAPYTGQNFGTDLDKIAAAARTVDLDENSFFPTLGMSVDLTSNSKLRLIRANTAIHPEFREIAPYGYNDYIKDRTVTGNTELRETRVQHLDLRYDWYLPNRQILSFSLFRKDFRDPVEPVADNNHSESFQNAVSAYVRGAEVEAMIDLESIGRNLGIGNFLKGWNLGGNMAVMHSEVSLDSAQARESTSLKRPMVGQSPYLINATLGEEMEWQKLAWTQSLAFNVAGERIRNVGIQLVPDEYEQPFPSLDYLGRITFYKHHQFTIKVKNLLSSRKRIKAREYNDLLHYYTVPSAVLERVYATVKRQYTLEESQEGTAYELGYTLEF